VCASGCAEVLRSNWASPMYADTCHSLLRLRELVFKTSNAKVTSSPLSEVVFEPSFWPMATSTPFPEEEGKDSKHKKRKLIDKQCNSFHQRTAAWSQCRIIWTPSPFVLYSQVELSFALKSALSCTILPLVNLPWRIAKTDMAIRHAGRWELFPR
jgi:hypothetical protein